MRTGGQRFSLSSGSKVAVWGISGGDDAAPHHLQRAVPHQYEEIPLAQFQQLLRQGKIEEAETQSPYDGHKERVYRLI